MYVRLPDAAAQALSELAMKERRDARDQAALLIIRALNRRRMVTIDGRTRLNGHATDSRRAEDQESP